MTRLEFKRIVFRFQYCHYIQKNLQINLLLQLRLYLNFLVLRSEALHQLCCQTSKSEVRIPSFAIKNKRSRSFFLILDTYSDTGSNITGYLLISNRNHWQPKSVERYPGKRLIQSPFTCHSRCPSLPFVGSSLQGFFLRGSIVWLDLACVIGHTWAKIILDLHLNLNRLIIFHSQDQCGCQFTVQ